MNTYRRRLRCARGAAASPAAASASSRASPRTKTNPMACEAFRSQNFQAKTTAVIEQANTIVEEYMSQGFMLTLRQLFYQFVARALLDNTMQQYKRLGVIVRDARDCGLVDWDAIEDRTREVNTHVHWHDPGVRIKSAARAYREDLWAGQPYRPEVWIEKDALLGVI